jgi:hypothetical protein
MKLCNHSNEFSSTNTYEHISLCWLKFIVTYKQGNNFLFQCMSVSSASGDNCWMGLNAKLFFMVRELGIKVVDYLFFPKQHVEFVTIEDFIQFVYVNCNLKPASYSNCTKNMYV